MLNNNNKNQMGGAHGVYIEMYVYVYVEQTKENEKKKTTVTQTTTIPKKIDNNRKVINKML